MPKRRSYDEPLALAIASGLTVDEAAARINVSRTAAYRRWRDPAVKQLVAQLRAEMVNRCIGLLSESLCEAVITLKRLMRDGETDSLRLKAAERLLETGLKAAAIAELERRIVDLETATRTQQCSTPWQTG
jgi:AcrR family transcriptional regulator